MLEVVNSFEHREEFSAAKGQALFTRIPVQTMVSRLSGDSYSIGKSA